MAFWQVLALCVVFVPQIFILFVGISLLEDTGYLARAVALMDGPLSKIGLSGQAFVPFLSGYACAIPSVLLVRRLSSKREKLMTFFSIPFYDLFSTPPRLCFALEFLVLWTAGLEARPGLKFHLHIFFFIGNDLCIYIKSLFKRGS